MIQPIVLFSQTHNILRTKTKVSDVEGDKDNIQKLILDMKETLDSIGGLGIAANQIGRNESVCIVKLDGNTLTMINPQITSRRGEKKTSIEGCLSIPDVSAKVERDEIITVKFVNPDGLWSEEEIEVEFPNSVVIQHEVDHLNGKLMIDDLSPMQKNLIQTKLKKVSRGNTDINYVGMIWRESVKSWSLVGPMHKLMEFYNYHSTDSSFSTNGDVDVIGEQEEGVQTEENSSREITEHQIG